MPSALCSNIACQITSHIYRKHKQEHIHNCRAGAPPLDTCHTKLCLAQNLLNFTIYRAAGLSTVQEVGQTGKRGLDPNRLGMDPSLHYKGVTWHTLVMHPVDYIGLLRY